MKAIRVHELGGPEVLRYEDVPSPEPQAGQALVKIEAIGLNYVDCNFRMGAYQAALPFIPGMEAAGTVAATGSGVVGIHVGDRVVYAPHMGAYAEYSVVPADRLVPIPDGMDARTATAAIWPATTWSTAAGCAAIAAVWPATRSTTALPAMPLSSSAR